MEQDTMGRVMVEIIVENLKDAWDAERGLIKPEEARRAEISSALVDTGATTLCLPKSTLDELGLGKRGEKRVRTSMGTASVGIYDAARLTIMGRECTVDVMEVPDDVPALVGQIPLEMLDFVVDPRGQKLIGNPAHGGEHILEMY